MTTRFILVRHGQTEWNRGAERFRGHADMPLNETGLAQAQKVAQRLANEKIVALYSSPLQRALQTAQPLADLHHLEIQKHDGLLDIDFGAFEGMTLVEARQAFPEVAEKWIAAPGHVKFPKGDSFKQVRTRIEAMLEELASRHAGETVALVSHKVICGATLCVVLGLPADAMWRIQQDNACINTFESRETGWLVTLMNETAHL
ncbi:MAG TPA: histidine phosphatase family protein [Anaerolineae bacterium]